MPTIALNGLLVLVPSAVYLYWKCSGGCVWRVVPRRAGTWADRWSDQHRSHVTQCAWWLEAYRATAQAECAARV